MYRCFIIVYQNPYKSNEQMAAREAAGSGPERGMDRNGERTEQVSRKKQIIDIFRN